MEKWELAFKDYKKGMKYKDIAQKYDVSINTVKSWKSRKWNDVPLDKEGATKAKKVAHKKEVQLVIEDDDLTEQQKMFCLYYLEYKFNATKAYQEAYGASYKVANTAGSRLLGNVRIKNEIRRLKASLQNEVFVDVKDLIAEYIKQSFADITDFTDFGTEEAPLLDSFGVPLTDEESEEPMTYLRSFVRLKNAEEVDGSLIQEVKKGKDGVSVKLYDKQKAMAELMKYLGGNALREAQIKNINLKNDDGNSGEVEDDGFLDALEAAGEDLWPQE